MRKILVLIFLFVASEVCGMRSNVQELVEVIQQERSEPLIRNEQFVHIIEEDSRHVIDDIFNRVQESITAQEDIITAEWLAHKEIKEIQHLVSDAYIVLDFDSDATKAMSEKLQAYLQIKMRNEIEKVFAIEDVRSEDIKQFFYVSRIVCELNEGSDCRGMMHAFKNENAIPLLNLRMQEKIERRFKKEAMRKLREHIILGAHPRR